MQFFIRTLKPAAIDKTVPSTLSGLKQFGELVFEVRNANEMWMRYRNLPWVKLLKLDQNWFFDDRSLQRQFSFRYQKNRWGR